MTNISVIYGPRKSGKTTKLLDMAALTYSDKRIVAATIFDMNDMIGMKPLMSRFITTIFLFNTIGLQTDTIHIFLDNLERMPINLVEDLFQYDWKSITVTGTIKYV